ncbi:MAG TPA: PD-(D/E)XK nuclease family protein [Pirellulales bacterium]|jgi:hypothetical protein|nr:PD-(D/E)XK nuclease family protein [Pirellulales bacterium]
MPLERIFLGCDRPCLPQAADWLIARSPAGGAIDLADHLVVLPGAQAGRRLEEILVDRAAEHRRALAPPEIVTVGHLAECLYRRQLPLADEATQELAWIEAVRQTPRDRLSQFFPVLPDDGDLVAWLAVAELFMRLHDELAAQLLDFADVAERGRRLIAFNEAPRWQLLTEVQRRYLDVLKKLCLCDKQTARRQAIAASACRTDKHIVLLACVDLNRAQRAIVAQVAKRVTTLVFAPRTWSARFDTHGCVVPSAWCDVTVDIKTEQIELADRPAHQADAVVRALASFDGRWASDEITVGVVDESLATTVEERLAQGGVPARFGAGMPLARSGPYRLLEAAADYVSSRRFDTLAALVRHPAIMRWLERQQVRGDWLTLLDKYYAEHLPLELSTGWLADERYAPLRTVRDRVTRLLTVLCDGDKPWSDWSEPIAELLIEVFGSSPLDPAREDHRVLVAACDAIAKALRQHQQVCAELAPRVSGSEALRLVLRGLRDERIPPRADPRAIELLGWLELALDDAPALVMVGFNEEVVPRGRTGDLFLPNALRCELGVEDNDQCFARDGYALSVIAASRQALRIIAGRRSAAGDPLMPSRLLFTADEETIARRAQRWFDAHAASTRVVLAGDLRPGRDRAAFAVPLPQPLDKPVETMRVTEFRDYLACPYRYYLRHRLDLKQVGDAIEEMDDGQFGSMVHTVLETFAASEVSGSGNDDVIRALLEDSLERVAAARFGKDPLPAVLVQIEQMRLRLRAFAKWQAEWSRSGYRIRYSEAKLRSLAESGSLSVDGRTMNLVGRIDRIDFNEQTGEWAVLDYKTGDAGRDPKDTHRKKDGTWIDLQLPLYRHLLQRLDLTGPLKLGYIILPKALDGVKAAFATWTEADLTSADEQAREVVRGVWAERFWPPATLPPAFSEEFAAICQDHGFGALVAAEESEALA